MNETSTSIMVDANPPRVEVCKPMSKFGMGIMPCFAIAIYLAFLIFFIMMIYRFVKAHEKIANKLEDLVNQKKES